MRKLLVGLVLVGGVAALGYWGVKTRALDVQAEISERAQIAVSGAVHTVETTVEGRDIRISGLADSADERAALIAALDRIEGRRVVIDDLTVLTSADPYTIAATRKAGQTLLQGNVPSEDMRAVLAQSGAAGVEGLTLASGAPERWETAIGAGLKALSSMDEGSVSLNGTDLRLTGLVELPEDREALIASLILPEGYTLQNDIETRDDGVPIGFGVSYDVSAGASVDGKLPAGLDLAQVGAALGIDGVSGEAITGKKGDPTVALNVLSMLKPWLPDLETAKLTLADETFHIDGTVTFGVDFALLQKNMVETFGDAASLSLAQSDRRPQEGAERVNVASGQTEHFQFGSWRAKTSFTPSLEACAAQSDKLMNTSKITFLSGSSNLDPRSENAINAMAELLTACVRGAGLFAELGGHTDSAGSGNYELSAARAVVVQNAMIRRGVPSGALSAIGYGPSKPIASNDTAEGRSANRRISVRWARQ